MHALLYTPGREDDDSGLQVFGFQQQRRQVGVLAEQQHLLRLEDQRAGRQVTPKDNEKRGRTKHHRTHHRTRIISFEPSASPPPPTPTPRPRDPSLDHAPSHPREEWGRGQKMETKKCSRSAELKENSKSKLEYKEGGAKSCAWCGGTCKLRRFQDSNQPTNQGRAC